jgi:hypothetical protein
VTLRLQTSQKTPPSTCPYMCTHKGTRLRYRTFIVCWQHATCSYSVLPGATHPHFNCQPTLVDSTPVTILQKGHQKQSAGDK